MQRSKGYVVLLIVAIASLLVSGCANQAGTTDGEEVKLPISRSYFIFDTIVTLRVYDERMTDRHFDDAEKILNRIDQLMNRFTEGSEIDQVNKAAGQRPVRVSEETYRVVSKALRYSQQSGGKFDLTVGPLVDLWGIGSDEAAVPDDAELAAVLPLVNYRNVTLDEANRTVELLAPGMSIDLGAIAKGHAADVIRQYLTEQGFSSAIIDLGGNIVAMNAKPDGSDWTIGVQDPAEKRGEHLGILKVRDRTIVTSGVYERFFKENGAVYHHILNPADGYPVQNNLLSVTIVTESSADADAMSTLTFAMGLDEGKRYIENREDAEAIFVTQDKKVYLTSGLQGKFKPTNGGYELAE